MNQEIVLIRGLPGSGKSTMARAMAGYVHYEADMYMVVDGKYVYSAEKISKSHDWCVSSAKASLNEGHRVVVSNTFIKLWEMQRYVDLGFPFRIIEATGKWPNIHGVPQDKIQMMKTRWDCLPDSWMTSKSPVPEIDEANTTLKATSPLRSPRSRAQPHRQPAGSCNPGSHPLAR